MLVATLSLTLTLSPEEREQLMPPLVNLDAFKPIQRKIVVSLFRPPKEREPLRRLLVKPDLFKSTQRGI